MPSAVPGIDPFSFDASGELAAEHAVVSTFVQGTAHSLQPDELYRDIDPKKLASGQVFVDAEPEKARRFMLAALKQVRYWDQKADEIRASGDGRYQSNSHFHPQWKDVWNRRRNAESIVSMLTKRNLPLQEPDLIALLEWCTSTEHPTTFFAPLGNVVRAAQRLVGKEHAPHGLVEPLTRFARTLRSSFDKSVKRLATNVEQLCAKTQLTGNDDKPWTPPPAGHVVQRAPAGDPLILSHLKAHLKIGSNREDVPTTDEGLDHFALPHESQLKTEHQTLSALFSEVIGKPRYAEPDFSKTPTGLEILAMDESARGRLALAAAERSVSAMLTDVATEDHRVWQSRTSANATVSKILELPFTVDRNHAFDLLLFIATTLSPWLRHQYAAPTQCLIAQVEREAGESFSEGERYVSYLLRSSLIAGPPLGSPAEEVQRLTRLIGDDAHFYLVPGEFWSETVNAELRSTSPAQRRLWLDLIRHCLTATAARPTDKWLKTAKNLVATIGEANVSDALLRWFPPVSRGRTFLRVSQQYDARSSADVIQEENGLILRGLLWAVPMLPRKHDLTRHISTVANSAYRKVPGVGPRAVKVGNAAVYALSEIGSPEAVGQLAMLKVRVKFGTAQKEIEKAFNASAQRLGMSREDIEELGVPTYCLEEVGIRRETFGSDFVAELRVDGREVSTHWTRVDGKELKSVPAAVRQQFKDDLKELQGAAKDIAAMLPAQSERLDSMFLLQKRWPIASWRDRYLNHPLLGTLARRLIWNFTSHDKSIHGIWHDGQLVDVDDNALTIPDDAQVELWHPIGRPMDDVLSWRTWLERHQVRQPFKQAHREVYLLTDAERRTETYSNRFAAHVLRQHQFNALCAARGWKNKLRLMVDDSYPPASRDLPNWGLRAEFWIEGIGDNYGVDTNDSGAFLRVSTDQVRFYRTAAASNLAHAVGGGYTMSADGPGADNINIPLTLDQVPPLVLSEIMRDVDLFVGVASVGNDPTWQDGGPEGRFRTYWHGYSFGELSQTAQTRRAVLETLLPRLTKIRDRCSLSDRFLVVRGDIRTYKIHLGSGNILMEPNDQYLCIVPSRGIDQSPEVFLPFEGDATLSIILSKAFLLAQDKKIKDPTIVRQIS